MQSEKIQWRLILGGSLIVVVVLSYFLIKYWFGVLKKLIIYFKQCYKRLKEDKNTSVKKIEKWELIKMIKSNLPLYALYGFVFGWIALYDYIEKNNLWDSAFETWLQILYILGYIILAIIIGFGLYRSGRKESLKIIIYACIIGLIMYLLVEEVGTPYAIIIFLLAAILFQLYKMNTK